ncbi:MAG: hypothetical protein V9G63_15265 [Candidatus Competibacter sp.]
MTVLESIEVLEVIDVFVAVGIAGGWGFKKVLTATQAEMMPVSAPIMPITMLIFAYLGSMLL